MAAPPARPPTRRHGPRAVWQEKVGVLTPWETVCEGEGLSYSATKELKAGWWASCCYQRMACR
jgi:hypothetical protein